MQGITKFGLPHVVKQVIYSTYENTIYNTFLYLNCRIFLFLLNGEKCWQTTISYFLINIIVHVKASLNKLLKDFKEMVQWKIK